MCLYPRFIKNKRYCSYKLKKGDVPIDDYRKLYVPIGCGKCIECKRQKAQQWKVRLMEELKVHKYKYFVTLTFSNESLDQLCKKYDTEDCNGIATEAVRLFTERYRKRYKISLRHWLITELGHEGTERIHIHGVIFTPNEMTNEELTKLWKYGRTDTGQYCNEQTINYIVKYVTKLDIDHKNYEPIILCSNGLGANYLDTWEAKNKYKYKKGNTPEDYTLKNGRKVALPLYYRNKLYTEKERSQMWTDRLDKNTIYVNGIKCAHLDTEKGQANYYATLKGLQEWNKSIGYGDTSEEWATKPYNVTLKQLNARAREKTHAHAQKQELADHADDGRASRALSVQNYIKELYGSL